MMTSIWFSRWRQVQWCVICVCSRCVSESFALAQSALANSFPCLTVPFMCMSACQLLRQRTRNYRRWLFSRVCQLNAKTTLTIVRSTFHVCLYSVQSSMSPFDEQLQVQSDQVWHDSMMKRYPSEISFESVGSNSTGSNSTTSTASNGSVSSLITAHSTLRSLDRLDGHPHTLRRRPLVHSERYRQHEYEDSNFFADDNSEAPKFKTTKKRSAWLIPADHPYKIMWDLITVIVAIIGAYNGHSSIRDRSYGDTAPRLLFCECWFFVDIILNFATQHKSFQGRVLKDGKSVWARYLTTWFVIDLLSLLPWECVYVKPIIEMQNRMSWFGTAIRKSKAVVRVTRILRGRHLKLFGKVARRTKQHGVGTSRLLRLLIKYLPKYIFFWRRMRGVVVVRVLRMLHYVQRLLKNASRIKDDDTSVTQEEWEELQEEWEDDLY